MLIEFIQAAISLVCGWLRNNFVAVVDRAASEWARSVFTEEFT